MAIFKKANHAITNSISTYFIDPYDILSSTVLDQVEKNHAQVSFA